MDSRLNTFLSQVGRFETAPCDPQTFRALSRQAVALYEHDSERGEQLAHQMTGVWFRSAASWPDGQEKVIGQLFADLEVPAVHVEGGEAGAAARWAAVKRLVEKREKPGGIAPPG